MQAAFTVMGDVSLMGLIVGLGNPGPEYRHTPHNFGFLALESLLRSPEGKWTAIPSPTPKCDLWRGQLDGEKWLAAKPLTYMNLSGNAVGPLARWYKIEPERILVVHDELDLPLGRLRFKHGGGAAGHKGILSIATALNSNAFFRLRIGIGRPEPGQDPTAHVLRRFSASDQDAIGDISALAAKAILVFCVQGPTVAMQALHAPLRTNNLA